MQEKVNYKLQDVDKINPQTSGRMGKFVKILYQFN